MVEKLYDKCLRCNRVLKTEETRLRGYGNTCWKKIQENNKLRLFNVTANKTYAK